jgi:hypothetical protein
MNRETPYATDHKLDGVAYVYVGKPATAPPVYAGGPLVFTSTPRPQFSQFEANVLYAANMLAQGVQDYSGASREQQLVNRLRLLRNGEFTVTEEDPGHLKAYVVLPEAMHESRTAHYDIPRQRYSTTSTKYVPVTPANSQSSSNVNQQRDFLTRLIENERLCLN